MIVQSYLKCRIRSFVRMVAHEKYMQRCLELASMGSNKVAPNPMVGSLLVYEDRILSEGFHASYGGIHAERDAIHNVTSDQIHLLEKATLYVNLEPCVHFGKTPPCADLIIEKKIKTVVIGCCDPNPLVSGKGVTKLKEAGTEVITGILESECRYLNRKFITYHEKRRPYITLKWAQTKDKFIAKENNEPVHFTNPQADMLVHNMRAEHMAIFAGLNTILSDNPQLNVRYWKGANPVRVTFDKKHALHGQYHILNKLQKTILFNYAQECASENLIYIKISQDKDYLVQIIEYLFSSNIQSLLVEGGTKTLQQFISGGYWDEAKIFVSERTLGAGISAPIVRGNLLAVEKLFNNELHTVTPT